MPPTTDDATSGPSAAEPTGGSDTSEARSDIDSGRSVSEAALVMSGWMLMVAGVVLLLLAWLRRKRQHDLVLQR